MAVLRSLFKQGSPCIDEGAMLVELWFYRHGYRPYADFPPSATLVCSVDADTYNQYHDDVAGFRSHQRRIPGLTWGAVVAHICGIGKMWLLEQKGSHVASSEDEFKRRPAVQR